MKTDQTIGLIGIGFFLCISLLSFDFVISKILEETLIWTNLPAIQIHGLTEYLTAGLIIWIFYLTKNWIKRKWDNGIQTKKIFKLTIFAFLSILFLQLALSLGGEIYQCENYHHLRQAYRLDLSGSPYIREFMIDTPAYVLKYLLIGGMIWKELKNKKTVPNNK